MSKLGVDRVVCLHKNLKSTPKHPAQWTPQWVVGPTCGQSTMRDCSG